MMDRTTTSRRTGWQPLCCLLVASAALALAALAGGCDLFAEHDLSMEPTPYLGDALRIDGYYRSSYTTPGGTTYYEAYFLNRNGVLRHEGVSPDANFVEAGRLSDGEARWNWGLFRVEGRRLTFERWYPGNRWSHPCTGRADILNDTTFVVRDVRCRGEDEDDNDDQTFRFRAFSPKPDSTSRYVG